jgi:Protein of unknown function (DUF3277).
MEVTTYSFEDVNIEVKHSGKGSYATNGEGVGTITVSLANDRTAHDIAADGSTMVSKLRTHNGTITISVQQTSSFNRWLTGLFNYLDGASAAVWADATITIRCPIMGEQISAVGVSPQKQPDTTYQAQGGQISWVMMAADIRKQLI